MSENTEPLVSVIVPIYNVEKYLAVCVESILNQTYSNFELILINDGSPDKCGEMCDVYAKSDKRIKVIHKENGGLSDARNVGIKRAVGEYVALIDSDDFVSPFFLEVFVSSAILNDSDIVCLNWSVPFFDGEDDRVILGTSITDFISGQIEPKQALKEMFYKKRPTGAPFNLYRREIFNEIQYPVGYYFEDLATTYKTYIKAKSMSYVDGPMYAYRKRKSGIMLQEFSEKKMIVVEVTNTVYHNVCNYDIRLKLPVTQRCFDTIFFVFLQVPDADKDNQKILWKEIVKYRKDVLFDRDSMVRRRNRMGVLVSYLGMRVTHKLGCFVNE